MFSFPKSVLFDVACIVNKQCLVGFDLKPVNCTINQVPSSQKLTDLGDFNSVTDFQFNRLVFELCSNKRTESRFRGIISILYCSKQRKMQIIPLNLDSVLLLLHNSKLAYYTLELARFKMWLREWRTGNKYSFKREDDLPKRYGTSLNEKSCKPWTVQNEESICPALRLKRQSKTQRYYFFMVHVQFEVYTYLRPVVDTKRNSSHCYRVSSDEIAAEIEFLQSV